MIDINNNIISHGSNTNAKYLAFGDDSQYEDILVFAYVLILRSKLNRVISEFEKIKEKFKFSPNSKIRCRVLFSGHQREKNGLGHLTQNNIRSLLFHVVTLLNKHDIGVYFSYASASAGKLAFGENTFLEMNDLEGNKSLMKSNYDPKGILGILSQSCWAGIDATKYPTVNDCEIFAAEDETKINWIGDTKNRADRWLSGFSDVGAPQGSVFKLKPSVKPSNFSPCFELADIAAYIYSHSLDANLENLLFKELTREIKLWKSTPFKFN